MNIQKQKCEQDTKDSNYIRFNQIKLPVTHTKAELDQTVAKLCRSQSIPDYIIVKKSLDARHKDQLKYIYSIEIPLTESLKGKQKQILKSPQAVVSQHSPYQFEERVQAWKTIGLTETGNGKQRPVIVGTGPAGLFCGYMLAKAGYQPLLIERGSEVDQRVKEIEAYLSTGKLNENCNVQFGEGGAGTFSDGKLNTMTHDKYGRIEEMLRIFAEHGADPEILYLNKPHIGTDQLRDVVRNIRRSILELGGEVLFDTCLTDLQYEPIRGFSRNGYIGSDPSISDQESYQLTSITYVQNGKQVTLPCQCLILALGHSARDTFSMLERRSLTLQAKPFAIGLRIEHKADMINRSQYGTSKEAEVLPAADYKLTYQSPSGRSVYSFCMCPGGHIIDASSEQGHIAVNGMSYHARNAQNSNSAIVVNITPEDCYQQTGLTTPLAGVEYQRIWERAAYQCGKGGVPLQLYGDFRIDQSSKTLGSISPDLMGRYQLSNLRECLPNYVSSAIIEGIAEFGKRIAGFDREDAILCGVESRTSSPVRILRGDTMQSNIRGIFPCGEGAGYAGGITSAAVDGIKVAEAVSSQYARP